LKSPSGSDRTTRVVEANGTVLEQILHTTYAAWHDGLTRKAYAQFDAAHARTPWGRVHRHRVALVEGGLVLASAERYDFAGMLDQRSVRVCGIGHLFTEPELRNQGHAFNLVELVLAEAAREGASLALLFSDADPARWVRRGFAVVPCVESEIHVIESARRGAPMTMVRAGETRDLAAIAAMGQTRAAGFRFHLDRDADFIQYAITKRRLLAGLGPAGARQVQFYIAEEGITAAAYIVLSVVEGAWTIEECGDRDPSGARVGALLQALVAREPIERRPRIRGWLPCGFVPPQITIAAASPVRPGMFARHLAPTTAESPAPWNDGDALFWHSDVF
jgi:GNAT superfamily N-acetyltransferase